MSVNVLFCLNDLLSVPSPITSISSVSVSPSTAHVYWTAGISSLDGSTSQLSLDRDQPSAVGPTGRPVEVTTETELASRSIRLLAYYIERDQRPARLTLAEELFEDGLRPSASCNVTICIRRLQVARMSSFEPHSPRLPLLSTPVCATGLRGLPLVFGK